MTIKIKRKTVLKLEHKSHLLIDSLVLLHPLQRGRVGRRAVVDRHVSENAYWNNHLEMVQVIK